MIYELRIYEPHPGKMQALQDRFANFSIGCFERHGMKVVGFWTRLIGGWSGELIYILGFESLEHREKAFAAFFADPERQRVFAESEKDGPLVRRVTNEVWRPTPFSPMQ